MNNNMRLKIIVKFLMVGVLMAIAVGLTLHFVNNKPKAKRKKPASLTPVVTVQPLKTINHQTVIETMGTVIPAKEVTIKSRVIGEVVKLHPEFLEGGLVKSGAILLQLDDVDYKLVHMQKKADLAKCESDLKLEEGKQDIARREWELLGTGEDVADLDRELALRVPQLKSKKAALDSAKVAVEKAEIDLQRTKMTAPFNALILSADVQKGDQVNSQTVLAKLVGTDSFHVQVSLPVSKLRWIKIPGNSSEVGASVTVVAGGEREYKGRVIKLLGDIEPAGRMARLLVEIEDPFCLKKGGERLLLGEYVRIKIDGKGIDNAVSIPRTAYHNNSEVWVVSADKKLRSVKTAPLWEERNNIFIPHKFNAGDKLITSDLGFPVEGMKLRIAGEEPKSADKAEKLAANAAQEVAK